MSGVPWMDTELAVIRNCAGKLPLQTIAAKINRTPKAVKHKAAALGLILGEIRPKPPMSDKWNGSGYSWSPDEDKILEQYAPSMLARDIGSMIGRNDVSVRARAAKIGISLTCETTMTSIGRMAEDRALQILPGSRLLTRENYKHPYDMEWEGKKINVKGASLGYQKHAKAFYWFFSTKGKCHLNCDYFLCLGFKDDYSKLLRAWLIPGYLGAGTAIVISKNGKNHKYVDYEIGVKLNENLALC